LHKNKLFKNSSPKRQRGGRIAVWKQSKNNLYNSLLFNAECAEKRLYGLPLFPSFREFRVEKFYLGK